VNPKRPKPNSKSAKILLFTGLAFEMAAIIGIGVWAGVRLDRRFGTRIPWFTVGLSVAAVALALYYPLSTLLKWQKEK